MDDEEIPIKQREILQILLNGPIRQNELHKKVGITAPALLYHLDRMERNNLILKKTIFQVGNAKNNEISINPTALQHIREILGLKMEECTLITGYGKDINAMNLPDNSLKLLIKNHFKIKRIIHFTTPDAKEIRDKITKEQKLLIPDRIELFDYKEYRFLESELYTRLEGILSEELKHANVILDLTPLSKMFSFKLLELANKYHLLCFYIGMNKKEEYILYWFTNMKIEGSISS